MYKVKEKCARKERDNCDVDGDSHGVEGCGADQAHPSFERTKLTDSLDRYIWTVTSDV